MIFNYYFREENADVTEKFSYEVELSRVEPVLKKIVFDDIKTFLNVGEKEYETTKKIIDFLISRLDMIDDFASQYEDALKDYFQYEALRRFRGIE